MTPRKVLGLGAPGRLALRPRPGVPPFDRSEGVTVVMPTPPAPKWPSDRALRAQNKVLLAERLRWPDGALQACQDLEKRYPGWNVHWLGESIRGRRRAGFHASFDGPFHKVDVYAPTVAELEPHLDVPEHDFGLRGCAWCWENPYGKKVLL